MIKKTITYTDYNGKERTEDFLFNLTEAELAEMEMSIKDGYSEMLNQAINAEDTPTLAAVFKKLIRKSYGQKSPDGRKFVKSEELSDDFEHTPAYSKLVMELLGDQSGKTAAEFFNGVLPNAQ